MDFCPWESAQYFVYSSNIPTLFFYSHFPAIIISLILGFFVFFKSDRNRMSQILLTIISLFSIWSLIDLILWATNDPRFVLFFWSLQVLVEPMIFLFSFYLIFVFIKNKDFSFWQWILVSLPVLPIIFLLSTNLNLIGVDVYDCNATEGFIAQYYSYVVELIFILLIFIFSLSQYFKIKDIEKKREVKIFSIGLVLFLIAFSWGNIIGSFTDNWVLAQVGLIGMPIFIGFLSYMIVRFKTFNIKLLGVQALVWGLIIIIGAQFFFIKTTINFILTGITFIASIFLGNFLINSVKQEVNQRVKLEKINVDLSSLLTQRESLVHLITHKVKASFTRSKYIFAEMVGGGFGELNPELKDMSKKGLESDNEGIKTVDLVLNAFNLEKGIVKYEMAPLDFKAMVLDSAESRRDPAVAKGLKMELNIEEGDFVISGDAFWLKEVTNNLIENAVRYTKEGSITVSLTKKEDKLLFTVKDTGVGINDEDKKNLFTEGGRGKNSVKVNVDSTGYGLFSVKLVVEAHGGRVWAESEGEDKGSTFLVELNLAK